MGGQRYGKFVNVYSIKIVNEGSWVVRITVLGARICMQKFVNINCEHPLMEHGILNLLYMKIRDLKLKLSIEFSYVSKLADVQVKRRGKGVSASS